MNDLNAFNKIRKLNLDIIIDVMGYTSKNRIGLFKNRIAKKQAIWMGYCNTTGLKNMDYIITDPNLIYDNEKDLYAEQILYLPKIWNTHCGFDFARYAQKMNTLSDPNSSFSQTKILPISSREFNQKAK